MIKAKRIYKGSKIRNLIFNCSANNLNTTKSLIKYKYHSSNNFIFFSSFYSRFKNDFYFYISRIK